MLLFIQLLKVMPVLCLVMLVIFNYLFLACYTFIFLLKFLKVLFFKCVPGCTSAVQ